MIQLVVSRRFKKISANEKAIMIHREKRYKSFSVVGSNPDHAAAAAAAAASSLATRLQRRSTILESMNKILGTSTTSTTTTTTTTTTKDVATTPPPLATKKQRTRKSNKRSILGKFKRFSKKQSPATTMSKEALAILVALEFENMEV
jgi:hypothetical protein